MGKPGPPEGNTNGLRHGARSQRHGILLTQMRRKYPTIYGCVLAFRHWLEQEVTRTKGVLSVPDVAMINLVCTYEMTARIAESRVSAGESENPVADMKTACWAKQHRQSTLEKFGIDLRAAENACIILDPSDIYAETELDEMEGEQDGSGSS